MSIDLKVILKELGWPVGLIAVLSAVLLLFGVSLDNVRTVAGSLVGLWACVALIVNVLKTTGVVNPGTAGKWSALFNLAAIIGIAVLLAVNPAFNFPALDGQLQVIAQFGMLLLAYVTNIVGSKSVHNILVRGVGIRAFTFG